MSVAKWLLCLLGLSLSVGSACATRSQPTVQEVQGPDGTRMLHVDCRGSEAECYRLVGQRCQAGYELYWTVSRRHGQYLARCRRPRVGHGGYAQPAQPNWGWARETKPANPWVGKRPPSPSDAGADVEYGALDLGY